MTILQLSPKKFKFNFLKLQDKIFITKLIDTLKLRD
jgi:hypothetical protein